jgi:leader peptidase (prepilin peptidase)/N-methyltransferase
MNTMAIYIWVAGFGLIIGSFLNVLIFRIPRKIGFVSGRSHCPSCKHQIKFYDNIPVVSYLILRGKCRHCRRPISIRYPLVEILNGAGYLFFFLIYGFSFSFAGYAILTSILIAIFFIDLDFQIIPDLLTIPGIGVGFILSFLPGGIGIIRGVIGLLVGGGLLYLAAMLGDWIFKKESMGGGDIKMAAMLGIYLGWQKIIFVFIGASFVGLIISLVVMFFSKKVRETRVIPFGPYLAIAAMIAAIWGDKLIDIYIRHFLRA